MQQILGRRGFLKMVGAGLASTGLQKLNAQSKPGTPTSEKEIPSKSFVDFLKKYGDEYPPSMIYREGQDFLAWQPQPVEQWPSNQL